MRLTEDETTDVINNPHKHEGKILTIQTKITKYKGERSTWTQFEFLYADLILPGETIKDEQGRVSDVIAEKRVLS